MKLFSIALLKVLTTVLTLLLTFFSVPSTDGVFLELRWVEVLLQRHTSQWNTVTHILIVVFLFLLLSFYLPVSMRWWSLCNRERVVAVVYVCIPVTNKISLSQMRTALQQVTLVQHLFSTLSHTHTKEFLSRSLCFSSLAFVVCGTCVSVVTSIL